MYLFVDIDGAIVASDWDASLQRCSIADFHVLCLVAATSGHLVWMVAAPGCVTPVGVVWSSTTEQLMASNKNDSIKQHEWYISPQDL